AARRQAVERTDVAVARDLAAGIASGIRPLVDLAAGAGPAPDLESPGVDAAAQPEDAERDPDLRAPAGGGLRDLALPDLVPVGGQLGVVVAEAVDVDAGGAELEVKRAPAIVAGVDVDADAIIADFAIAARQPRAAAP